MASEDKDMGIIEEQHGIVEIGFLINGFADLIGQLLWARSEIEDATPAVDSVDREVEARNG